MKIVVANDHAGVDLKLAVMVYLEELGHEVVNLGTDDKKERVNYPDYGEAAACLVASGDVDFGVIICGTGVGIAIAANKIRGIRAAVCSEPVSARLAKEHNKANMIALGARVIGVDMAKAILDAYMNAEFQGGRHSKRIALIDAIEEREFKKELSEVTARANSNQ